jgi:hypothetical protein
MICLPSQLNRTAQTLLNNADWTIASILFPDLTQLTYSFNSPGMFSGAGDVRKRLVQVARSHDTRGIMECLPESLKVRISPDLTTIEAGQRC